MLLPSFGALGTLWDLAKKVDRLLALEEKQSKILEGLQNQIDAIASRMDRLEAREEIMVAKAEGAARAAAMASATAATNDLARAIGRIEGHIWPNTEPKRLTDRS